MMTVDISVENAFEHFTKQQIFWLEDIQKICRRH